MSYTELSHGKLVKIENTDNLPIEEFYKSICDKHGYSTKKTDSESWRDILGDYGQYRDGYYLVGDDVYQAIDMVTKEDCSYFDLFQPNPDGSITFVAYYHNGGTCLSEIIEYGIKELGKVKNS